MQNDATGHRVVAIVPLRGLENAKSRLGAVLDAEERRDLVATLLDRVIRAALATASIDEVLVVSPDPATLDLAAMAGGRPLRQAGGGLNGALEEARALAVDEGASAVLVLPADLPAVDAAALDAMMAAAPPGPAVVLAPDRHGRGTNALLLIPAGLIPFAFGGDSRAAHARLSAAVGATYVEVTGPLELDLDTADDLLLEEARHSAASGPGSSTGPDRPGTADR